MTAQASRTSAPAAATTTPREVEAVIGAAEQAGRGWRRTSPGERAAALRAAATDVRDSADELGAQLCATTGRLLREAVASARVAADLLEEASVLGLGAQGRTLAGSPGSADWTRSDPYGVVAVLTPWNDPFPAAAGLLAAALVTGNTVVHKPSERSLEPGLALARLLQRHLPEGVLGLVAGDGGVGERVVRDERVRLVAHVGSSATGAEIAAVCGARGAKALLENGGKDPLVVDSGVDPRWAAQQAAVGAFTNAGQLCTAVERVYVHRSLAEPFLDELVRLAGELRGGDPRLDATTMCRLVDGRQHAVVREHVEDALERGARCLTGGVPDPGADSDSLWFPPTVLTGCDAQMLVMSEETFGPVAPVVVVDSWAEGLEQAASGAYGLAATVLTADSRHALEAVEELDVGTVKVNAVFGGAPGGSADPRRASGHGCGYGPGLFSELVLTKAVHWEPPPGSADAAG